MTYHCQEDIDLLETLLRMVYRRPPVPEDAIDESYTRNLLAHVEGVVREAKAEQGKERPCTLWNDGPAAQFFGITGRDLREAPSRITLHVEGQEFIFCNARCCVTWLAPRCSMEFYPHENIVLDRKS